MSFVFIMPYAGSTTNFSETQYRWLAPNICTHLHALACSVRCFLELELHSALSVDKLVRAEKKRKKEHTYAAMVEGP